SIALADPQTEGARFLTTTSAPIRQRFTPLTTVELRDESLSLSAVWGKSFTAQGKTYGHVIDPRLGEPVHGALMSACVLPSAAETDALSTALLVGGLSEWSKLSALRPNMRALVVGRSEDGALPEIRALGLEPGERA
ncbi:MAG: FAD:protein FMN transferase, partial [Verrucomicrobiota bacterium]